MKLHQPFWIAFLGATVSTLILMGFYFLNNRSVTYFLPASFVVIFLVFYLIVRWFIHSRHNSLYTIIRELRNQGRREALPLDKPEDALEQMNKEIREWSEERKTEIEQLKRLETYRKEFLGNVSHELKTPIFNIQGYILTLLEGGLEDPKVNKDYLKRAEKSVDRMISIVEDLQSISQLETGELELEYDQFDINSVIRDVIDAQELKARSKGITLSFRDENPAPVMVVADKFRIRQVLVNLVVNSVKYGKENGETRIKVYDAGTNIHVEVADNGIGINKEHLPRLFERFYRVDKSRSREMGGTGLGLSIVKHIIEAHGQTITVMSTEGAGSVFTFTLKKAV